MADTLLFVYNAESGIWNATLDSAHKLFSPKSYVCSLCAITHGTFGEKKEWTRFLKDFDIPIRFLHKDQWQKYFQRTEELPAVFLENNGKVQIVITAQKMKKLSLITLIKELEDISEDIITKEKK